MQWFRHRRERGRPRHPDVLTPAEWRVLEEVRAGRTNTEIAARLGISVNTVRYHVSNMLAKLELRDRSALASWHGEPAEASRAALGRFALGVPLGWAGKAAAGAGVVVLSVGAVAGISWMQDAGAPVEEIGTLPAATQTPTQAATPTPAPTPPREPEHAPDGRTGIPELDALIERLLADDASTLAAAYPVTGTTYEMPPSEGPTDLVELLPAEWTERLTSGDRELYAVSLGDPRAVPSRAYDVVLVIREPDGEEMGWRFGVDGDFDIVDVSTGSPARAFVWSVSHRYDLFLVLPPVNDLPVPPPGNDLVTRTGVPGVDRLLELLEARDGAGLAAHVADVDDELARLRCGLGPIRVQRNVVEGRVASEAERVLTVHAVAEIPSGTVPNAERLIILVTEIGRYRWDVFGILERDGSIVGIFEQCHGYPTSMYPPRAVLLPPPDEGIDGADVDRRSGVDVIDATLDALRAGDEVILDRLADPVLLGCVEEIIDFGSPPECEEGEEPGTLVESIAGASCHGWYSRRAEAVAMLGAGADWRLYAVNDIGESDDPLLSWPRGTMQAVFVTAPQDGRSGQMAVLFTEQGYTGVRFHCGGDTPALLTYAGRDPHFLLAPPP